MTLTHAPAIVELLGLPQSAVRDLQPVGRGDGDHDLP